MQVARSANERRTIEQASSACPVAARGWRDGAVEKVRRQGNIGCNLATGGRVEKVEEKRFSSSWLSTMVPSIGARVADEASFLTSLRI